MWTGTESIKRGANYAWKIFFDILLGLFSVNANALKLSRDLFQREKECESTKRIERRREVEGVTVVRAVVTPSCMRMNFKSLNLS